MDGYDWTNEIDTLRINEAAIFQSVNLSRVPRNVAVKAGRPDIK